MDTIDAADVIIVGAGPAGAWAAFRLARAGARVALVDGSHPREKPCGGGVTGRALSLIADALPAAQIPSRAIRTARFSDTPAGRSIAVTLPVDTLIVASRAEFDGRILAAARQAGAVLVAARALDVGRSSDGFTVVTGTGRITAPRLIGADGANSLVRRRLARPFSRGELSIATGYFAHGAAHDDVVIEIASDPAGYYWSFPRPGHLAVGLCAQADEGTTAGDLRGRAGRWMQRAGADSGHLVPYSWPIPSLSSAGFGALTVSGPGWFLAGDAAGLVDPITREGIYFALRSGELAAEAAASTGAAHEIYRERIHDEIAGDLAIAARYKAGFFRPRFSRLLIDALAHSAAIRAVMADLVAGNVRYSRLKWTLLRTFQLRMAWRLLASP
jgi:geranylgeranyl reductase family protein